MAGTYVPPTPVTLVEENPDDIEIELDKEVYFDNDVIKYVLI